jgi:hypothetical protein
MVHGQPSLRVTFPGLEGDDICETAAWSTSRIDTEAKVRCSVFIGHQLTVGPGGVRRITQDLLQFWKVFDEACELSGVMSVPSSGGERMYHPGVHIDADVQFDAVPSAPLSCDTDVVPGAALMGAETGAVNRDGHFPSAEEPGDQVHRFPDVFDGESGHASMDDAVPGKHRAGYGDAVAIFHVSFDAVVGLIQTYLQEASDCDSPRIVSFSSKFLRLPGWWQPIYCFDYRFSEQCSEVAVHMVRNGWVHPLLCISHPTKNRVLFPYYLFRDEAPKKDMLINNDLF